MSKLLSCKFDIDTGNVELCYADGSMISIDCTEVAYEFAHTVNQRSELDWLAYNAPLDYARLVLDSDLAGYLKRVSGSQSVIENNT